MDLETAKRLAIALMRQHNLTTGPLPWAFRFNNSKRQFGCCRYGRREISLSKSLTLLNNVKEVRNTILHEIAHALCRPGVGHGPQWKKVAESLGCTPERCYGYEVVQPERKYVGTCPECGHTMRRHRRNVIACRKCCNRHNGGQFDERFLFIWR